MVINRRPSWLKSKRFGIGVVDAGLRHFSVIAHREKLTTSHYSKLTIGKTAHGNRKPFHFTKRVQVTFLDWTKDYSVDPFTVTLGKFDPQAFLPHPYQVDVITLSSDDPATGASEADYDIAGICVDQVKYLIRDLFLSDSSFPTKLTQGVPSKEVRPPAPPSFRFTLRTTFSE